VHYNLVFIAMAAGASVLSRLLARSKFNVATAAELLLVLAIFIFNPVAHIQNDTMALAWSVVFLLPLLIAPVSDLIQHVCSAKDTGSYSSISYSNAALIGFLGGLISIAALRLHAEMQIGFIQVQRYDLELMFWVMVEHVILAILIASAINLIRRLLPLFVKNVFVLGPGAVALVAFVCLSFGCFTFVENSLSLRGWAALFYSVLLAATITLSILLIFVPIPGITKSAGESRWRMAMFAIVLIVLAICVPLTIAGDDWNGFLHQVSALLLWVALATSICAFRPSQKRYSIPIILTVVVVTVGIYETLNHSKSAWAADVAPTKAQFLHEMSNYAEQNSSFAMVDKFLGNQESEPCEAACKTLRQYSNIRKATIQNDLKLVNNLLPTSGPKPNIFIIVVDSLRPDYLGAYNPRVDFTPNLNSFARDSVVMRRAYTDYAGTSLSEPSIWSGSLLLHSHYAQPFEKVNSLEKLARTDGYQIVLSYDVILRQIIPPSEDIVKLDTDKKTWGAIEVSSTIEQLEKILDQRGPQAAPVLFYTQPMNVQINADNNLPKRTSQNWQSRTGFDDRIAYTLHQTDTYLGNLFSYLKKKKLYDDSIIILTADHGDATGELGRTAHSTIIYPEVVHVPLIVHLPPAMRANYVYDENRLSTLIDIAPSLYYLLGHRPVIKNPLFGHPMFVESKDEFLNYPRPDVFLASDALAVYGILDGDGRWMYATYDSPSRSMLFDLLQDPTAQHNVLTPALKEKYDQRILCYFQSLSEFFHYYPNGAEVMSIVTP